MIIWIVTILNSIAIFVLSYAVNELNNYSKKWHEIVLRTQVSCAITLKTIYQLVGNENNEHIVEDLEKEIQQLNIRINDIK